jgi:hypothetical protein
VPEANRVLFFIAACTAGSGVLMAGVLAATGRPGLSVYALGIASIGAVQALLAWRRLRA